MKEQQPKHIPVEPDVHKDAMILNAELGNKKVSSTIRYLLESIKGEYCVACEAANASNKNGDCAND